MKIFNEYAASYDEWFKMKKGKFIDEVETDLALNLLELKDGDKILDIGCGTGNFSIKLAKLGYEVIGVDISDKMLDIAKLKAEKQDLNLKFINMDTSSLNFSDEVFDAVVSMAAFEFIIDKHKAFKEILRVVKKSGQILIGTINGESEWGKYYKTKDQSVFEYAEFTTMDGLKSLYPDNIVKTGECLFVSPLSNIDDYNMENEKRNKNKKGGYICALWKK